MNTFKTLDQVERESNWMGDSTSLILSGVTRLHGNVKVQGSKNTAQKLVPMCAQRAGHYRLRDLPLISDTFAVLRIIEHLGGSVQFDGADTLVDTTNLEPRDITRELTVKSTGTFQFAGALLSRFGRVRIAKPGGDKIGGRPVDVHLDVFRQFGAEVREIDGLYELTATKMQGCNIRLPIPSAGVLINAILAAANLDGSTTIENIPVDADIRGALDFARYICLETFLSVNEDGVSSVKITPREAHTVNEIAFQTPPDRNDAATWIMAGAAGHGPVSVANVPVADISPLLEFLKTLEVDIEVVGDTVRVSSSGLETDNTELRTGPSPGFHSDWGQLALVLLSLGRGKSKMADMMFEGRYSQVPDMQKMGADIEYGKIEVAPGSLMFDRKATSVVCLDVTGRDRLRGAAVVGRDVRGAAALALAGSLADGETVLRGIDQLARGYEFFDTRLRQLGASCKLQREA